MTSVTSPLFLLAAGGILLAAAFMFFGFKTHRWKRFALIFLGVLTLVPSAFLMAALNPWLVDARYRTYRKLYNEVEIGMTRKEVWQLVDQHYSSDGKRQRPIVMGDSPEGLGFFMNPEHSRHPNCEGIFLTIEDGKVIQKVYSPD